jgi:signal transduction histidine kinase
LLFTLAYASLLGHLFGITSFYKSENFSAIAHHTALGLMLLNLSILLLQPDQGWMKTLSSRFMGGRLARFTFTYLLMVAPLFVGCYLYGLDHWQFTPGEGILSLFFLACIVTLPIAFFFLHRLNKLDAQLQKANENLQVANQDLYSRNQDLNNTLTKVQAGNQELATLAQELRLSTQSLEAKNKELEHINRGLDDMLHMIGHDLKSPIYNLQTILTELQPFISLHPQAEVTTLVTLMNQSVGNLKNTIEGLIRIIRSQQAINEQPERISVPELLQEVQKEVEREIYHNSAQISVNLEVTEIMFSRIHLRSIFLNLLTNALKYRAPCRPPEIEISTQQVPGGVQIIFADNGMGMSEKQLAKLFTIFRRFHRHIEGSGIGLYLVKRTIENSNGNIQVESTEGEGTRFIIFLPQ